MFSVVFGAVRARAAQALMVFILAALPAAAAAAVPWYGLAVGSRVAGAAVTAAPATQKVLLASAQGTTNGDPQRALSDFAARVHAVLPMAGAEPVLGLKQPMLLSRGRGLGNLSGFGAAYRQDFCAHVRLTGTCPAAAGEAVISSDVARRIPLKTGEQFSVRASAASEPVSFRITGIYTPADPAGAYWTDQLFTANGQLDPFFTTLDTFAQPQFSAPVLSYDLPVPAPLLRGDDGYRLGDVLAAALPRLRAQQITLAYQTAPLLAAIRAGRATIQRGILGALAQVLVLGWFAIGLAGRYTSRERRGDAGLLKLRGNTRLSMLRLALGQHLVPLLAGALAGLPLGFFAAWALAGRLPVPAEILPAALLSVAAVTVVLLGGLAVLAIVDAAALRLPVAALLRRVAGRRRGWRSDVVDLALVAVAAFAVYQAHVSGPETGLAVAAPALVALAVALVLARFLRWFADRAGGVAVRRGRLRFGLTAIQVSRQTGTDRVFALIVVAVAMFAVAAGGFVAGRAGRADRSEVQLGATRVLWVQAGTRTELEYAVRRADPTGERAMAVVVDQSSNPPVLAVDSSRLAAVARWRPEYGSLGALTKAAADARLPAALPLVTGSRLVLRVTSTRDVPSPLYLNLQNEATGAGVQVAFKGVAKGEQTISAPVNGCSAGPGCRLVRWQLTTPPGPDGEPAPGTLTVQGLTQQDPPATILDGPQLADVTRWYSDFTGLAVKVTTTGRGLTMAADNRADSAPGDKVYAVDAPLPLPIVLAGPPSADWRFDDALSYRFGPGPTPVRVAGTASVLPVLGRAGVLVDLDMTRRLAADAELGGVFQVWLAPGAPASVVDDLRAAGLTVTGEDTTAAFTERLAGQADVVGSRFGLLTAAIALLLAAAMVAVAAAVERGQYTEQLRALRIQGLPRRSAVVAGWAGTAGLVTAGLIAGLIAAAVAVPVAAVVSPPFADGWRVLPPPDPLTLGPLAAAGLIALLALGLAAWLSVRPLLRRLRGAGR